MDSSPRIFQALFVEDDETQILITKKILESLDVKIGCDFVKNGEDALTFLMSLGLRGGETSRIMPDLFILDLKMPKVDGITVTNIIRSIPRCGTSPVVVISGSEDPVDIGQCYQSGVSAYVIKPEDPKAYAKVLEAILFYWGQVVSSPKRIVQYSV